MFVPLKARVRIYHGEQGPGPVDHLCIRLGHISCRVKVLATDWVNHELNLRKVCPILEQVVRSLHCPAHRRHHNLEDIGLC